MKMTEIIWDADQREIPGCGVLSKGDKASLPDHVATSLVYQGLAHKPTTKQPEKEKSK
jgi:hypothetical protein